MNTHQLSIILNEVEQLGGAQAKRNLAQLERLRCCCDALKAQLELCCKELMWAERMCEETKIEADRAEKEIEALNDKIAELFQQRLAMEKYQNEAEADYDSVERLAVFHLQQQSIKRYEIDDLQKKIAEIAKREKMRRTLLKIPFVNIGAAIENAINGEQAALKQNKDEVDELSAYVARIEAMKAEMKKALAAAGDKVNEIKSGIYEAKIDMREKQRMLLETKEMLVRYETENFYCALLKQSLGTLVANVAETLELGVIIDRKMIREVLLRASELQQKLAKQ